MNRRKEIDITVVLSGSAGQGIQTVGSVLARTVMRRGYWVFSWQEYESRIRGGANSYRIRISESERNAPTENADLFIPLDRKSKAKYLPLLRKNGILLDEEDTGKQMITVPFTRIAQDQVGNKIFSNSVALGAVCAVLGIGLDLLSKVLKEEFSGKGDEIIDRNLVAAKTGHEKVRTQCRDSCGWKLANLRRSRYLISGNEALALGAAAAGCRFMAAYPMTPSTGIITYLSKHQQELKVFTEQAEDEIGAVNMAIGAGYAGVRAMTATSGGGFALMTEGISLAVMTETPLVVVLGQRPAPATGLPTRTEQGDLLFAVHAGHGEFPKLVMAPSDPQDAFRKIVKAFNLADRYQIPVIILTDQLLAESAYTLEHFQYDHPESVSSIATPDKEKEYNRYRLTPTGISPRLYPGQSRHLVCCDSDEHDESGHITENLDLRIKMVEKRIHKGELLRKEIEPPETYGSSKAKTVLISWGSSRNAVFEAVNRLSSEGKSVGALHFTEIWPLPRFRFPKTAAFFTVESNATGQLHRLLKGEYGLDLKGTISRYDGLPLDPDYIVRRFSDVQR